MKLRANHLTLLRILLLPFPYFLVYGDRWSRVAALIAFAFLGLTDYLDGLLARRDGGTSLGRLLDPIADKIFIAVTLIPLVDLGLLPLWMVWPIFLREFLVTELRNVLIGTEKQLQVTELAKIKTTVQMIGAGLILLTDTFPERSVSVAFLAGALLATVFIAVGTYLKEGELSSRLRVAMGLLGVGFAVALLLESENIILVYGLIMLAITWASGFQYFRIGFPVCMGKGWKSVVRLAASIVLPLVSLALMPVMPPAAESATGLIVLILAIEFVSQGLDMWAVQENEPDISWVKRMVAVPAALAVAAFGIISYGLLLTVPVFIWITAGLCLAYALIDMWVHRRLIVRGHAV
ncbi:MAG TPA: hypothetical protein EYP57_08620 [Thermodesulfobacteriaceae bacterium]|nr:hypothetical protein [Thermodesulfobacteriaceae bacterium]